MVTAGGAGIGREISETQVSHGASAQMCDVFGKALETLERECPQIDSKQAEVSDPAQVDRYFSEAVGTPGGLDLQVNNAGIAGPTACEEEIDPGERDRTVAVSSTAPGPRCVVCESPATQP